MTTAEYPISKTDDDSDIHPTYSCFLQLSLRPNQIKKPHVVECKQTNKLKMEDDCKGLQSEQNH